MTYTKLDPMEYPLVENESWWIIHPNMNGGEFIVPCSATTACINDFLEFKKGIIYRVVNADRDSGWVSVANKGFIVEMPQYVFARNFDAEIFIRGSNKDFNISPVNVPTQWTDGIEVKD